MKKVKKRILTVGKGSVVVLSAQNVQAAIDHVTAPADAFVSLADALPATYNWDIDGDGNFDFQLATDNGIISSTISFKGLQAGNGVQSYNATVTVTPFTVINYVQNFLNTSVNSVNKRLIGPDLVTDRIWNGLGTRKLLIDGLANTSLSANVTTAQTTVGGNFRIDGRGYDNPVHLLAGFRFNGDGPTAQYAWARFEIVGKTDDNEPAVRITEWAYETTPGTAIEAGAIPEPETMAVGLGLLALGAAGLRTWRKRLAK
ncbi:PEP-CTERM sorting domain-containing protein [Rubellicoccus peritrichatus]|uniref:PEP-CTERM sorting domain-containing protein n=1 Tax=Rubellicoccus peritrichatus TaxID=3080537 RepID=A0AAQ3QXA2_9BACT|nr:PEP-CTERM sorting domain-containing protein [Puniceicoccus sp. CR14]WOO43473.1 PEP-CTERM sorting domain-containing protein [Puniceicoccus sp. CR14]